MPLEAAVTILKSLRLTGFLNVSLVPTSTNLKCFISERLTWLLSLEPQFSSSFDGSFCFETVTVKDFPMRAKFPFSASGILMMTLQLRSFQLYTESTLSSVPMYSRDSRILKPENKSLLTNLLKLSQFRKLCAYVSELVKKIRYISKK